MAETDPVGAPPAPAPDQPGPPPAQPGPPPAQPGPPSAPARKRRGYFLPGAIALVALLLIGGAVGAGDLYHPAPRTLNGTDVAQQISLGVQAQRNDAVAPRVVCPGTEPVAAGRHFSCTLHPAAGPAVPVMVTEVDGRGRLHWSLGEPSAAK